MSTTQPRPATTAVPAPDLGDYGTPARSAWLDVDWQKRLHSATVHGSRVNYVEMGDGPPVVFVHGLSGCWQNWLENIPHFSQAHRTIAVDLPGFGESELPGEDISIPGYGRFIDAFLESIGVERAVLVGNSMGGFISAEAAIEQPKRFEKLVLVSAAGVSSVRVRRQPAGVAARMIAAATPLVFRVQTRAFRRRRARAAAWSGIFYSPGELRPELIWEFFQGGFLAESFVEALTSLIGYDILDRLEEVEVPTLIVWGANDRVVPPADALGYAQRLRNSRLEVFDRTGHVPMAERPVRFNRVLGRFLADG
jgi:pimeloyl-ACP methyl ester carboxylesterase